MSVTEWIIRMVFTTEGFVEVAIESLPAWGLNPRPLNICFTVLWCRHEVRELKKTFCRNAFTKKCVFSDDYPVYMYIYEYSKNLGYLFFEWTVATAWLLLK